MRFRRLVYPVGACVLAGTVSVLQDGCSGDVARLTLATPAPPIAVVASAGLSSITVAWTVDTSARVSPDSFRVYGAIGPWTEWSPTLPGAFVATNLECCQHVQTGLANETTYSLALAAEWEGPPSLLSAFVSARPPGWRGTMIIGTDVADSLDGIAVRPEGISFAGWTYGVLSAPSFGETDLFVSKADSAGREIWRRQFGGVGDDYAWDLSVDGLGNHYVVGQTYGDLDGETNLGEYDGFVVKFDGTGEKEWSRLVSTTADDVALAVASDESSFTYVAGWMRNDYPGPTANGFVAKYDSAGQQLWLREIVGTDRTFARSVCVAGGFVYVTGVTTGDLLGETNPNLGSDAGFVSKFTTAGDHQWTRLIGSGGGGYDQGWGVIANESRVYVAGEAFGDLYGQSSAGSTDVFVVSFDAAGARLATRLFGSSSGELRGTIRIAPNGDLIIAGRTNGIIGPQSFGGQDVFAARLSTAGALIWSVQIGSDSSDELQALAVDDRGNVYVGGFTNGTTFDELATPALLDGFLVKYNVDGQKE